MDWGGNDGFPTTGEATKYFQIHSRNLSDHADKRVIAWSTLYKINSCNNSPITNFADNETAQEWIYPNRQLDTSVTTSEFSHKPFPIPVYAAIFPTGDGDEGCLTNFCKPHIRAGLSGELLHHSLPRDLPQIAVSVLQCKPGRIKHNVLSKETGRTSVPFFIKGTEVPPSSA